MFNLDIDTALSRGLLRELVDDTEAEITRHHTISAGFDSAAAGRDFHAYGAALDHVFQALHQRNLTLMQRAVSVSSAAHDDVNRIEAADQTTHGLLNAVKEQAWES